MANGPTQAGIFQDNGTPLTDVQYQLLDINQSPLFALTSNGIGTPFSNGGVGKYPVSPNYPVGYQYGFIRWKSVSAGVDYIDVCNLDYPIVSFGSVTDPGTGISYPTSTLMAQSGYSNATSSQQAEMTLIQASTASGSDNIAAALIPLYYSLFTNKPSPLSYYYGVRELCIYLMGTLRGKVDLQIGPDKVSASQKFAHIERMFRAANAEIMRLDPFVAIPILVSVTPCATLPDAVQESIDRVLAGFDPIQRVVYPL